MDSALVDAGSCNTFLSMWGWYKYRLQTSNIWSGEESLFCIVNLFPHLCVLGLGILLLPFVLQSAVPYIQTSNFCATNIWTSVNIQTTDFCKTDSLNFSLFKQQTFVQQTVWISVYSNIKLLCNRDWISVHSNSKTYVQQTSEFSWGFLRFSKSPKTCRVFGTAKISNLYDIPHTEYFINFWTLGHLEIVAPCQRLLLFKDENKKSSLSVFLNRCGLQFYNC
jgi:hypothetical protein